MDVWTYSAVTGSGRSSNPYFIKSSKLRGCTILANAASTFKADLSRMIRGPLYAPQCKRVQDLELFVAFGTQWRIYNHENVDVLYRRTSGDQSWENWRRYRQWHHYAVAHGLARRQGAAKFPDMADWWSDLGLIPRLKGVDPHEYLLGRYPHARGSASRLLRR